MDLFTTYYFTWLTTSSDERGPVKDLPGNGQPSLTTPARNRRLHSSQATNVIIDPIPQNSIGSLVLT